VGGGVYRWRTLGAMSSSGVWGHPEAASAAKGEKLLDAIAEQIAAKLTNKDFWALPYLSDKVEP
jgi:creatinine amidohydrolase